MFVVAVIMFPLAPNTCGVEKLLLLFFFCLADSQELLDSWLTLLSRLVNSDTLMDSPHGLPATSTQPGFVPFKPIDFLVATQKVSLISVKHRAGN